MKAISLFLLASLTIPFLTSCDDDEPAPGSALVGEWALRRTTGGIAGVDTTYAADDPPAFVTIGADGTFSFRHGPGHAGIPGFTTSYTATLTRSTDEGEVYELTFPDESLEGTAAFTGVAQLRGDALDFYDPALADGFTNTYVRR